ncbi:uncharacterized protein LACBIDRAFT_326378 [Laccaria bicolor S238N-H82]|uniref:Predicted protein n=1 Tax=Laccaria bicolor (strain S238N-H82 / ATCC MYA-4686) TaxID=486041 RepID=B0D8D7_LACBS|nr:uncharacterized protein LACBIDRAFT_326378 [Laccaria bicolor S238N-H82]EDR09058.1 predicted protein [Laccaria bicolor S238N-H82]|eukprot:XP_001880371.1 predicted protein [Laccaria bicolor S238N-H82]
MRISLIHAILVFLTIVQSVSAGWDSFLDFAKDTEKKVVKFSKEVGEKVEEFAKVAGENVVETNKEASEADVGFANTAGEEVARLAGVVAHDVDAIANKPMEELNASIDDVVVKTSGLWHSLSQGDARMTFEIIEAKLSRGILVAGLLINNMSRNLTFSALISAARAIKEGNFFAVLPFAISIALLLIPEIWFLGPLMGIFGSGPLGLVKGNETHLSACLAVSQFSALGSTAAWVQAELWGGAIQEGSWFATLQSAGMKVAV